MNSSVVWTTHFSLHENVNERRTSNPPEGIGDALYFYDFKSSKNVSILFFNKKINIARDLPWNMSHCFPTDKVEISTRMGRLKVI